MMWEVKIIFMKYDNITIKIWSIKIHTLSCTIRYIERAALYHYHHHYTTTKPHFSPAIHFRYVVMQNWA